MSKSNQKRWKGAQVHPPIFNSIPQPAHNVLIQAGFCFLLMPQILEDITHTTDIPKS